MRENLTKKHRDKEVNDYSPHLHPFDYRSARINPSGKSPLVNLLWPRAALRFLVILISPISTWLCFCARNMHVFRHNFFLFLTFGFLPRRICIFFLL